MGVFAGGLLAPMRDLYASYRGERVLHYVDNEATSRNGSRAGLEELLFTCSADVWDDIVYWAQRWGENYKVVWHRGHPERREPRRAYWTLAE